MEAARRCRMLRAIFDLEGRLEESHIAAQRAYIQGTRKFLWSDLRQSGLRNILLRHHANRLQYPQWQRELSTN